MAAEWPRLTDLYLEELPTGECPKLYKLMQGLRTSAGSEDTKS
jgi:hypothetical protein